MSNGVVMTHNETKHFISFLLQRDKDMAHYQEIIELQVKYQTEKELFKKAQSKLADEDEKAIPKASTKTLLLGIGFGLSALSAIGSFAASFGFGLSVSGGYFALLILTVVSLVSCVYCFKQSKASMAIDKINDKPRIDKYLEPFMEKKQESEARLKRLWDSIPKDDQAIAHGDINKPIEENKESELRELKKYHDNGLITDEEFKERKNKLLD